ncbi:MAG: sigma-70 family RNA polymerase sigma factor [Prevotella sp.]|nr:sigma-70 family RNA polymerase sigma factor [Prevotella sp.]
MEDKNLNIYLDQIGRSPLLTSDEERQLSERILQGDQRALSKLVEANLRFVVKIASEYQHRGVDMDDLISEGNIGLMRAASHFDASRGTRFVNYAVVHIRQQMERAISQQTSLQPGKDAPAASPTRQPASLDSPLGHRTGVSLLSVIVNRDAPLADARLHSQTLEDAIEFALGALDSRQQQVINAYFGIGQERLTMAEIGLEMGMRRERVRQVRDQAVRRLRRAYKAFLSR